MGIHSPKAVLDLSKPVLSLRNQTKPQPSDTASMIQYYNKVLTEKEKLK
jgi:hypothetical protein